MGGVEGGGIYIVAHCVGRRWLELAKWGEGGGFPGERRHQQFGSQRRVRLVFELKLLYVHDGVREKRAMEGGGGGGEGGGWQRLARWLVSI